MNTEVSLYVPHSPLAILILSLASSAAFNKSLVCSFFHLASFGFCLFLTFLLYRLTSCNIFNIFHPVYCWWGVFCPLLRFQLHTHPIWTWLTAHLDSVQSCYNSLMKLWWVNWRCSAGYSLFSLIQSNPVLSFDLLKFSGCNSGRRGVAVKTNVLYLVRLIIKKKLEYSFPAYLASMFYQVSWDVRRGEPHTPVSNFRCTPFWPLGGGLVLWWWSKVFEQRWLYLPLTQCQ